MRTLSAVGSAERHARVASENGTARRINLLLCINIRICLMSVVYQVHARCFMCTHDLRIIYPLK